MRNVKTNSCYIFLLILLVSCTNEENIDFQNSNNTNPNEISTSEAAVSALSGIVGSLSNDIQNVKSLDKRNNYKNIFDYILFSQSAFAQNNLCQSFYVDQNNLGSNPLACDITNTSIDFNYENCLSGTIGNAYLTGKVSLEFINSSCIINPLQVGNISFTRTHQSGIFRLSGTGVKIYLDSTIYSGYNSSVSGGTTINVGSSNGDAKNLIVNTTLTILGLNIKAITSKSKPIWEHTISSNSLTLAINGTTKTISSGTITVQQNLAKFTGTAVISSALIWTAPCNFPTQGTITTTLSGSKTGTESLVFQPNCSIAKLTRNGSTKLIQLNDVY